MPPSEPPHPLGVRRRHAPDVFKKNQFPKSTRRWVNSYTGIYPPVAIAAKEKNVDALLLLLRASADPALAITLFLKKNISEHADGERPRAGCPSEGGLQTAPYRDPFSDAVPRDPP